MKKVVEYLSFSIVVLLMMAAVSIYLAPRYGWHVDAVLSGSMEPKLKVGSLVVTRPVEPETIVLGDIITFRPAAAGESTVTHRVVSIRVNSPVSFETKGDANPNPDAFIVPSRNLVGKVIFETPYWGYFTEFLKTPFGFLFAIIIPGIIIITIYIISVLRILAGNRKGDDEAMAE